MTTSAVGKVVDEHDVGLPGLGVVLEDISQQFDVQLATDTTETQGAFSLTYADYLHVPDEPGKQLRRLRLRIRLGQHVLHEILQDDLPSQDQLTFASIKLTQDEANAWWATLRSGAPSRKTDGNAIRWLADDEDAWDRVAKVIDTASRPDAKLDIMQLTIDTGKFQADQPNDPGFLREDPFVVLQFDANDKLSPSNNFVLDHLDPRIERSIFEAYQKGAEVRIQLPKPTLDRHGLAVVGTAILGIASLIFLGGVIAIIAGILAIILGAAAIAGVLAIFFGRDPEIMQWFRDAGQLPNRPPVNVKQLKMRSNQYTHAKLVIDRDREALLLGSPFEQQYFDSRQHAIFNPRRGRDASKGPIHDVSVGVRGPAVGHLQEVFNIHWNLADPDDKLPDTPALPQPLQSADPDEFITTVQVVRTLDVMFTQTGDHPNDDGEQGVLESYLRAIHLAERFIYIENQYFNNDTITEALIDAFNANEKLQVILFLNATPDMPLYLGWQQKAIARIIGALKKAQDKDPQNKDKDPKRRFGAFTAWTHAASDNTHTKPRLVDNYLHTKSAIVDNRWAAVGSANLDGASLDSIQYARSLFGGDVRNSEANIVVFEEVPAQPSAVDALRRRLWSEHLGIADPHSQALDDPPATDWLDVWSKAAERKRVGLQNNLDQVLGFDGPDADNQIHALAWPTAEFGEDLHFWNIYHSHRAAYSYLAHLLSPDEKPSDVSVSQFEILGEKGPLSAPFTYK
ncbi:MAG TPA: phospholipase D-like domain-containing protein [Casimicrobiaceae bacterium]|nr:phospholipase D-like domain-containing protein [Casimicrobiaceae bacterium]